MFMPYVLVILPNFKFNANKTVYNKEGTISSAEKKKEKERDR